MANLGRIVGFSFRSPYEARVFMFSFPRQVLFLLQFTRELGKMLGLGVPLFMRLVMFEGEFVPAWGLG